MENKVTGECVEVREGREWVFACAEPMKEKEGARGAQKDRGG